MSDRVYEVLRKRIVLLKYEPGQVLATRELAAEFGVSLTPVREALLRLEMEGLVDRHPHRGIHVSNIGFQDLRDLIEIRNHMLDLTARLAARRAERNEIRALQRIADATKKTKSRSRRILLDLQFHNALMKCSGNQMLFRTVEKLDYHVRRLWAFVPNDETHIERMPEQFAAIAEAIRNHDEEAAVTGLRNHSADFIKTVQAAIDESSRVPP